jgi:hypothetical protein
MPWPQYHVDRPFKTICGLIYAKFPSGFLEPLGLILIGVFWAFSFWFGLWALAHNS